MEGTAHPDNGLNPEALEAKTEQTALDRYQEWKGRERPRTARCSRRRGRCHRRPEGERERGRTRRQAEPRNDRNPSPGS